MSDAALARPTRRPRFHRCKEPPLFQLTDRDIEIVRQVAKHRFLRSTHISLLLDASHKKICERLTLLYHAGYLDRPRSQLEYYVRGGGSAPYVYGLGNRGARLLKERQETDLAGVDWTRKNRDSTRNFLLHTLAVADFRVALTLACRDRPGLRLIEPNELLQSAPAQTQQDPNPWSWRVRVPFKGQIAEVGVIPDYVFALILPDGRRRPFVVECDRGTMPIERTSLAQTSILRKILGYETTRAQSIQLSRFAWMNFRVLVTTSSKERQNNIQDLINCKVSHPLLFLVAEAPVLSRSNLLGYQWHNAYGQITNIA